MEELLALLFLSREVSHRAHLKSTSYAQHMALGSFYEDIIPLADNLAEAYQGREGKLLEEIPYYSNPVKGDILMAMKKLFSEVELQRKELDCEDSVIQNIIDEIVALYLSTIYKLTFLK